MVIETVRENTDMEKFTQAIINRIEADLALSQEEIFSDFLDNLKPENYVPFLAFEGDSWEAQDTAMFRIAGRREPQPRYTDIEAYDIVRDSKIHHDIFTSSTVNVALKLEVKFSQSTGWNHELEVVVVAPRRHAFIPYSKGWKTKLREFFAAGGL